MRKRLLLGLGVAAGLVALLGATAYAAWTQGEARGYARGYDGGKRDERAADKPRLTDAEVVQLVNTYVITSKKPRLDTPNCLTLAEYKGNGLWFVNSSLKPDVLARWQENTETARYYWEKQVADIRPRIEEWQRVQQTYLREHARWTAGAGNVAEYTAAWEAWRALPPEQSLPPMPPMPNISKPFCNSYAYTVSDRTGNVTGP